MVNALSRFERNTELLFLKVSFDTWRENLKKTLQEKSDNLFIEEQERRIVAEASLSALQIELKEALERIVKLENKERKRVEKKKKKIQQKRREQMTREMARSLNVDETPLKVEEDDRNQLDLEDGPKLSSRDKLEDLLDTNNRLMMRRTFHHDQRGSVNTEMRQQRLKNRLLTHRGSFASSSVYSQARTEFSFHPTINYNSKWKPKYDDHHDHVKMWERMHDENRKIQSKIRLLSQEKNLKEIEGCTFTPKLVARQQYNKSDKPVSITELSQRMYDYASKFKEKKEAIKKKYESESGASFTPKINKQKALSCLTEEKYLTIQRTFEKISKSSNLVYDPKLIHFYLDVLNKQKDQVTPKYSSFIKTLNIEGKIFRIN